MQIIWNSSTRAELLKFVDQQRASQGPDGSYDLTESHSFAYEALSKELHVGNVYLRVYNNQPDYEISEPEAFCVALLKFIAELVHNLGTANVDTANVETLYRTDNDGTFVESSEIENGLVNGSNNGDKLVDSLDISVREESKKEGSEVVKNLQTGLTSLQVC